MYNLGFVITNYNNSIDSINAVDSLLSSTERDRYFVVIVDNNSERSEIELLNTLKKKFASIHLILNNKNLGYFKGLNLGIEFLRKNFVDINHIVIGNNDLIFPANFANSIFEKKEIFLKHAVISPNIVTVDGVHQNPHVIDKISFIRELLYDLYYSNYIIAILIKKVAKVTNRWTARGDEREHMKGQVIYQGHGSCYILGPLFFTNYSELWSPTFMMGEEFFLSLQLRVKNLDIYYEPTINVTHKYHASVGKVSSKKMWKFSRIAHKEYRKYIKLWR
jgi:hypothetical protein